MSKKRFIRLVSIVLLAGLLLALPSAALATSVDRMALPNLEGRAGETIQAQITLGGTEAEERSGYWYTLYKQVDGDDDRMDITSWITIDPKDYTIKEGQSITFSISIKIPESAAPGLWGATTEEAGQSGHSGERRTYLIFKDTPTGGNVYSGLLIPVSVKVLGETSPPPTQTQLLPPSLTEQPGTQSPVLKYIKNNIIVVVMGVIIIILLILLLVRMTARRTG
jgi:hypothetical protein